jgi:nitrite reductase/ring-hydroxylating ferredoxin subunit
MAITLCHSDEIPEGNARGFELAQGKLFAVKKKGEIYLYLNRCPHLKLPLEWEPHAFLDSEALYIKCSNHGATFIPESGECIQGPCLGESLWSIAFQVVDGHILIPEEELPGSA